MASEPSSEKFRWRMSKRHKNGGFLNNLVAAIKGWMEERGTSLKVSVPRLVLFCVVLISLFLAMTPPSLLVPVPFVVGQTFPYDIRAHRTVRYMSEIATERRRQAVAQAIPRQYRLDPSVASQWRAVLNDLIDSVMAMQGESHSPRIKAAEIRKRIGLNIPNQVLETLLETSPATLRFGHEMLLRALDEEWQRGIKPIPEERAAALQRVKENLDKLPLSSDLRMALKNLAELALHPNMVFDPDATQKAREQAQASVEPVWRTITVGELIARKGELVTEEHLEKLRALGYNFSALLGVTILALLLTVTAVLFTRSVMPSILSDSPRLTLLALIWAFGLLFVRFLHRSLSPEISFVTIATAAMMTTVLFSPLISIFTTAVFALATTLGMTMDWQALPTGALRLFLSSAALGVAASFLSADVRTRMHLVQTGALLGILAFVFPLILGLVTGETLLISLDEFQRLLLWALLTGSIPPALTLVGVSALERLFKITTVFTLTELANPNFPLLRELAEKAPGTFQSSLMVARLAQEAAKRIGANELLVWVGGLYHDIGKLKRPHYFVENQPLGTQNPHDSLSPKMSANVLRLHVDEGVEIAQKYRLPEPIVNVIREHHGTSVMAYFHAKARERKDMVLVEDEYRYRGPKPQSKESAIIMLADSVEAAVRARPNPTLDEIAQVIDEVVKEKVDDGQLEEAPINFRDLTEIKRAFLDTFKSIYHQRVEYPKKEHGSNGTQQFNHGAKNRQANTAAKFEKKIEADS
jgi:putative nucleotidyltransferase with HDIG domain